MTPTIGHNSTTDEKATHSFAKEQLKALVERIERVGETIKEAQDDQKEIYGEAKGFGYDVKALRTIIRMRKQDATERANSEAVLDTYLSALEMI
jgi:uncharacterized protein (UPF0335 family)